MPPITQPLVGAVVRLARADLSRKDQTTRGGNHPILTPTACNPPDLKGCQGHRTDDLKEDLPSIAPHSPDGLASCDCVHLLVFHVEIKYCGTNPSLEFVALMRFHAALPTESKAVALPTGTIDLQHALVTAPPNVSQDNLLRRQSPDLRRCGYINGNSGKEQTHHDGHNIWHLISKASEIRCAGEYSCAFGNPGFAPVFGCCNEVSCSKGAAATCVDAYNNICKSFGPVGCSGLGTIVSCPTACVTYVIPPTGMYEFSSYMSWSCGPSPTTIIVLRSTTNELPPDNIDGGNTATGGITDTVRQTTGFDPTTTDISVITNGPSASNTENSSNGVLSTGIFVAIAIGAVLVLMVGVAILVYCVKKNKKKKAEAAANADRQQQFNAGKPGGVSEAFLMSQAGNSMAQWILYGQDDRRTVVGGYK
ncbi:hypothetical protein DL765_003353 [Monosporascus sp. GIB2]|nr:hypothetical protein DL765_003353 [Monosporascus sp. GIB2]